jgi:hypothetical protein
MNKTIALGGGGAILGHLIARRYSANLDLLATTSKQFVRWLATIGENRLELLAVEIQAEREQMLHAFRLALGMAAFGRLASVTPAAGIVVLPWSEFRTLKK